MYQTVMSGSVLGVHVLNHRVRFSVRRPCIKPSCQVQCKASMYQTVMSGSVQGVHVPNRHVRFSVRRPCIKSSCQVQC